MIKIIILMLGLLFSLSSHANTQESDAPYIYYYSNQNGGIVIERADGTAHQILGSGLVIDQDVLWVVGPNWSSDGTWFAWHGVKSYSTPAKGYAVHIDGQTLPILDNFSCVRGMLWHPSDNILLVYGHNERTDICTQAHHPADTYWLIDADQQKLIAMFSFSRPDEISAYPPLVFWDETADQVQFIAQTYIYVPDQISAYYTYLITMRFDGTVFMTPYPANELSFGENLTFPDYQSLFTNWMMNPDEKLDDVPSEYGAVAGLWDQSQDWVLVGHEFCRVDCSFVIGNVSIFHPETGLNRDISTCGGHPSCVGWLPAHVEKAITALHP